MLNMVINGHFSRNTAKAQIVGTSATALDPLVLGDAVLKPENIFLQTASTNSEPIYVGFDSSVTAVGPGIQLPPGSNVNIPSLRYLDIYVVCASGGQQLNIVYSEGVE